MTYALYASIENTENNLYTFWTIDVTARSTHTLFWVVQNTGYTSIFYNLWYAGPEIEEIWTLEVDFEASSGIKKSTVEDTEKCTSTNTKRTTITRPIKWLSSRSKIGILLPVVRDSPPRHLIHSSCRVPPGRCTLSTDMWRLYHWTWGKVNGAWGLYRPWGFQKVETPRFQDNQHMTVVRFES